MGVMPPVRARAILALVTATLSFSCGGDGGTSAPPGPVTSVEISPATTLLWIGDQTHLDVTLKDARGRTIEGRPVDWSSSAPGIAEVSAGVVSGRGFGQAIITAQVDAATGSAAVSVLERSGVDRPDDVAGAQVHLLYVLPSDGTDRSFDVNGTIVTTVETVQQWLAAQTGGRRLRIDTVGGLQDLTFLRLSATEAQLAASPEGIAARLDAELAAQGFADALKLYVVYYDATAPGPCSREIHGGAAPRTLFVLGQCAHVSFPEVASPELRIASAEWHFIHDLLHTLDFVFDGAPHELERHTTDDPRDLLNHLNGPTQTPILLDVGRDDYYGENVPVGVPNFADSPLLTP